jgi:tetratricopeptide (TPR) repeat protein
MSPAQRIFSAILFMTLACDFCASMGSASESTYSCQEGDQLAPKIEINIESLKRLLLEGEKILENPEEFVATDGAYKKAAAFYAKNESKIVSEEWKNVVRYISRKIKEDKDDSPYIKLLNKLEAELADFAVKTKPILAKYLPKREYCRIDSKVYFTAFTAFDSMNIWDSVVINALNPSYSLDADFILNTLVHELYHSGYGSCSPFREEPMLEQKLYYILECLQNEGLATYVAYQASPLYPAAKNKDYSLAASGEHVSRLRNEINAFLSKISEMPSDQALRDVFNLGVRQRAFYAVGFDMARMIEQRMGCEKLAETVAKGPISFYELYNSLVDDEDKILSLDLARHLSPADAFKRALESADPRQVRAAREMILEKKSEIPQSELESFYRLGYRLLRGKKQYDQAEKVFELIRPLAENPSFAYAYLAEIALERGNTQKARELLSKSLEWDPSNPLAGDLQSKLDKDGKTNLR